MSRLDWTPPPFPLAEVLEGRWCRLEPLDASRHLDDIWAVMAGEEQVWTWMPVDPPAGKEAYRALMQGMAAKAGIVAYAVIDKADGRAKGHLWLMEIRPEQGVFEVGYITYAPALQRTRVATEAIFLCGRYGFSLGYRRFEWKCNNRNEPSKRAALRFGFQYEGLFRQHMVVKGLNRDTAWFSILDHEWPVRARDFERWLDPGNFDADGRQKVGLGAFNQILVTQGEWVFRRASLADAPAVTALKSASYLPNETIIGVPSLPRIADYRKVIGEHEVWLIDGDDGPDVALVLETGSDALLVWSIAVAPRAAGRGLGKAAMAFAEARAAALGFADIALYTNAKLTERIGWYERLGYRITHQEERSDRRLTHMRKPISGPTA